jgi:hypothetical protein
MKDGVRMALDGADGSNTNQKMLWSSSSGMRQWDAQEFATYLHEMGHNVHLRAGYPAPSPPKDIKGSVTDYGSKNEKEWFAEHFTLWMLDADAYEKVDPVGAQFVRYTLEQAIKFGTSL